MMKKKNKIAIAAIGIVTLFIFSLWIYREELEKSGIQSTPFAVVDYITPTQIVFRSNVANYLLDHEVEIYDAYSFTKLDKPILQDTTYTFTISELTPKTKYRIVYGDKDVFITTLDLIEELKIMPLGTEKTSDSFVQIYKVTGEDVYHEIYLYHEGLSLMYSPNFNEASKSFYVVFTDLTPGSYEYSITLFSPYSPEVALYNDFEIVATEDGEGIIVYTEPAIIGEDSFYLRFTVEAEYYNAFFEYIKEETFEKEEEVSVNHGPRYNDVFLEALEEGDYSYKLIVTSGEAVKEISGSFTIQKAAEPTYIPPYTPPPETSSNLYVIAVILLIFVVFVVILIFTKPKVIKTKKGRK